MSDRRETKSIILCPGQGAQRAGMGQAWIQRYEVARRVFDQADRMLGFELSRLCLDGPDDQLSRTDKCQAAIFTTTVASFQALKKSGWIGPVAAVAGLSMGEFTALHLAGAFDFETGLKLVHVRGLAMQQAARASPSGMVALVGANEADAEALCDKARGDGVLVPANFNCPGQVVVSGSLDACQRALGAAREMGLGATLLKVAGAFHSPLMQPAAERLAQALDDAHWRAPTVTVVSNVTARPHDPADIDAIKRRLVDQLTSPVRWEASMQWLIANQRGQYIELAPNKVLTGLMRRIDRTVKVQSHAEPRDE